MHDFVWQTDHLFVWWSAHVVWQNCILCKNWKVYPNKLKNREFYDHPSPCSLMSINAKTDIILGVIETWNVLSWWAVCLSLWAFTQNKACNKEKTQNLDSIVLLSHCLCLSFFPPIWQLSTIDFNLCPLTTHLFAAVSLTTGPISPLITPCHCFTPFLLSAINRMIHCLFSACWLSLLLGEHIWDTKTKHAFLILLWQTVFCHKDCRCAKKTIDDCVLLLHKHL